jgi:hypothetical protein
MKIQFPIQLTTTWTIHCSQGLTFSCLTFNLTGVTKYGLTYIALLRVHSKNNCIYFLCYWINYFKWIIFFKNKHFN